MSRPSDYVPPGYHEPIGSWPEAKLLALRDAVYFDLSEGYLPESAGEALFEIDVELQRRAEGGERAPSQVIDINRAREGWFEMAPPVTPALRGAPAPELLVERAAEQGPANENEPRSPAAIQLEKPLGPEPEIEP
jgi:hypothetical protein